jgi:hypothetical protein
METSQVGSLVLIEGLTLNRDNGTPRSFLFPMPQTHLAMRWADYFHHTFLSICTVQPRPKANALMGHGLKPPKLWAKISLYKLIISMFQSENGEPDSVLTRIVYSENENLWQECILYQTQNYPSCIPPALLMLLLNHFNQYEEPLHSLVLHRWIPVRISMPLAISKSASCITVNNNSCSSNPNCYKLSHFWRQYSDVSEINCNVRNTENYTLGIKHLTLLKNEALSKEINEHLPWSTWKKELQLLDVFSVSHTHYLVYRLVVSVRLASCTWTLSNNFTHTY